MKKVHIKRMFNLAKYIFEITGKTHSPQLKQNVLEGSQLDN